MATNEEKNKKVYDFIKGNIINAVIILTGLAYIFYGIVTIEETGLTVAEVVAKAGIGIVVAFIIKECMGENGFNYGYRSLIWTENRDKYVNTCNSANDYIERVDNFYACEEIEKKKRYRRQNMISAQMKYDWFFDKDGNYINRTILTEKQASKLGNLPDDAIVLTKHQRKILKKCLNVKIYNLNLFSEYGIEAENDTKKEKTDKNQRKSMFTKNALFGVVGAVVGAYFLPFMNEWSWAAFISSCVQVAIWISCGAMQLYSNFNYVCIEKVSKLKRKSELIIKFKKGCEAGLYKYSPYDEIEEEKYEHKDEQSQISSVLDNSNCSSDISNN
jgi:hypothetical protein